MKFSNGTIRTLTSVLILSLGIISASAEESTNSNGPAVEKLFATISTGGLTSAAYSVGSSICKRVNAKSQDHHVYCSILSSGGAVMNVDRLRRGNVTFALLKREDLKAAIDGSKIFANPRPFPTLRSVMSTFQLNMLGFAPKDSGITDFDGLKGKKVAIEPTGSDGDKLLTRLLDATRLDFGSTSRLTSERIPDAVCGHQADAGITYGTQPNPALVVAAKQCGLSVFSLREDQIKALTDRNPDLLAGNIQARTYANQPADIPTIGTDYVLVTTQDANPEIIKAVIESVTGQLPQFKKSDPVLSRTTREALRPTVSFAPNFTGIDALYDQ